MTLPSDSQATKLAELAQRYRGRTGEISMRVDAMERTQELPGPVAPRIGRGNSRIGRLLVAGGAAILLLTQIPRAWQNWSQARSAVLSFHLPLVEPVGLGLRDGGLVSLDRARGLLFWLNRDDLSVRAVEPVDVKTADALTWIGGELWTADLASGLIRRHGARSGRPVVQESPDPYRSPSSLSAEGASLWVLDAAAGSIEEHERGPALALRRRYPIGDFPATVAAVEGRDLWIVDARSRNLKRYRIQDGTLFETGAWVLEGKLPRRGPAAGLVADGPNLWLLTRQPAMIHRIRKSAL